MKPRMWLAVFAVGAAVTGGFGAGASAQTMSYSDAGALIAKSCGPSIEKYCPKDNLGTGKVMDCLKANQANVPQQCFTDYAAVIASISRRVEAQAEIFKTCAATAAEFCPGIQPGDGNLRDCLVQAKKVVKGACLKSLVDSGWY
ncbi:cysteine rich repeat-containing protein [Aquabacter sp. L1I39]|uniref:cysteine rich repeat-containing protein n=1 Tax=Aquabacter sp. L1I39 TaxID=2820278 RepID=UPI001FFCCE0E|nr:cysteine rich repeat-containing protein [Aquabacter sp. L1I39]